MADLFWISENILKCPVCGEHTYISEDKKSLFCRGGRRHCFDLSSDGYVSLARQGTGDSKAAVAARRDFLSKNYYLEGAEAIHDAVIRHVGRNKILLDAGCGEGYYTNIFARDAFCALGFDLSKFGVAAASKSARRECISNALYATASVFELPVRDASVDCVLNIFAPCAEEEFLRVLRPGGVLILVGAGREHLMGLKQVLYENTYENGERADLPRSCTLVEKITSRFDIKVDKEYIGALFSMTPYYWRTSESDKEKLDALDSLDTCVEFEIYVYRKN